MVSSALSRVQAPGFARTRMGATTITTVYDGALPILAADMHGEPRDRIAADMHGEPRDRIAELLADGFLPPGGDLVTAVNTFLLETEGRLVLIDAGAGTSLGPGTGHLVRNLDAAGVSPTDVDDVLITHLHPDHAFGLLAPDGTPTFPHAIVHAARLDSAHWLDAGAAQRAEGVQAQIHQWASDALTPYLADGRLATFEYGAQPVDGVTAIDLHGHTPGHSGYLLDGDDESILFWGDTMHSHTVQLPAPHVAMDIDSDRATARDSRARILEDIRRNGWAVGGAHLPFPGIGHIAFGDSVPRWVPAPYRPIESA